MLRNIGSRVYVGRRTRSMTTGIPNTAAAFVFLAEDGIRDKLVTGVQTSALPISGLEAARGLVDLAQPARPLVGHGHRLSPPTRDALLLAQPARDLRVAPRRGLVLVEQREP